MPSATAPSRLIASQPWLLVLVGLLVYANSLNNPFVFDDHSSILNNTDIRQLWPPQWALPTTAPHAATNSRPVTAATLAFNYALGALETSGYRALNIGIHLLCALALYGLLARSIDDSARTVAFSCALLWLVHPLNSQCVNYTIQRSESLVSLFYLLVLYSIARVGHNEANYWTACAISFSFIGMASKEVMVTAPLLALVYDRIFIADSLKLIWHRRRKLYLGLCASWSVLALLQLRDAHGDSIGLDSRVSPWTYALNQCWVVVDYLQKIIWPKTLLLDYGFPRALAIADIWPQALFLILALSTTALLIRRVPRFGYLPLTFFIIIAPTSTIIPLANEVGAERRVYLAMVGPISMVATAAYALCQPSRILRHCYALVIFSLVCGLGYRTIERNRDYATAFSIWKTTVKIAPDNPRAHNNLGFALAELKEIQAALEHYHQALAIDPDYPDAHYNLGNAYMSLGKLDEAIIHYRQMIEVESGYAPAHVNLGNALRAKGEFAAAAQHYFRAQTIDPHNPATYNNLGTLMLTLKRYSEATHMFEEALRVDPNHVSSLNNLGLALRALGKPKEASQHFLQAIALQPDFTEAHYNLGLAWRALGRTKEAVQHFRKALELQPDFSRAQRALHDARQR